MCMCVRLLLSDQHHTAMRPKSKGSGKAAGMKRKREKMTPKTTVDDMFSMIDDDDDDDSVSQYI